MTETEKNVMEDEDVQIIILYNNIDNNRTFYYRTTIIRHITDIIK